MNKHQVKGSIKQAVGGAKQAAGKAVGNDRLRAKGAAEKAAGKVQGAYGDAKDSLKKGS